MANIITAAPLGTDWTGDRESVTVGPGVRTTGKG